MHHIAARILCVWLVWCFTTRNVAPEDDDDENGFFPFQISPHNINMWQRREGARDMHLDFNWMWHLFLLVSCARWINSGLEWLLFTRWFLFIETHQTVFIKHIFGVSRVHVSFNELARKLRGGETDCAISTFIGSICLSSLPHEDSTWPERASYQPSELLAQLSNQMPWFEFTRTRKDENLFP